ncbi:MAG: hypothetical protein K2P84_02765 [Undibacterium sp.]|nr:hypothetical protein [Undibacterium sp.]
MAALKMQGGKSPRQKVWEAIRGCSTLGFTQAELVAATKVNDQTVKGFIRLLHGAGFLGVDARLQALSATPKCQYRYQLVKDVGLEAPRFSQAGELITTIGLNQALWGTLRRMFKTQASDHHQLAAFASTQASPVLPTSAKNYLRMLNQAGYLDCVEERVRGKLARPAKYRLKHERDKGPRSPILQNAKQVFDPNMNKVVWVEQVEVADE